MAPQSTPHKRGGTHRVLDEHKTNTVFDDWNHTQLLKECRARRIPCKDVPKHGMARLLADDDAAKKRAERDAVVEGQRKQQALAREKQEETNRRRKRDAERHSKRIERQKRRDRGEAVSDESPNEDELKLMYEMFGDKHHEDDQGAVGGAWLSEESWNSTSTESSSCSTAPAIVPDCRLRLFEWTYVEMPSPVPRPSAPDALRTWARDWARTQQYGHKILSIIGTPVSPTGSISSAPSLPPTPTAMGKRPEPTPRAVPYAPLKIHTTLTKEKLFLPGQTYPPGVDPDYVPLLSPRTRHSARNGHLVGILRKATIERATSWASRTQIQGWNARMFFSLPACNEDKELADVYTKWMLENRKLLRVNPKTVPSKQDRQQRHNQRHKNKPKKLVEVLEASAYRPPAICYLPAYLDFHVSAAHTNLYLRRTQQTLDNLFYIKLPGCDVPHYYFWGRQGEWRDPTVPNPEWRWEEGDEGVHALLGGKRLLEREEVKGTEEEKEVQGKEEEAQGTEEEEEGEEEEGDDEVQETEKKVKVQVLDSNKLEALHRRCSVPALWGERCEKWLEGVEVESLASELEIREECKQKVVHIRQREMGLVCPFCLEALGGLGAEDQAKHMFSHSAIEQPNSPRTKPTNNRCFAHAPPARRPIHRVRPASNHLFDTGADGDTETSDTKSTRIHKSQRNSKANKLVKQTLQSCCKASRSDPRKCTVDSLAFLSSYDNRQPSGLDRRSSRTAAPSRAKKRGNIADPTYRATKGSSSEEDLTGAVEEKVLQKPAMRKRKRIADPTFRLGLSSDNDEGVVERPRKRSKKRSRNKGTSLPKSLPVGIESQGVIEKHGDAMEPEGEQLSGEDGVIGGAKEGRSIQDDEVEFVWERDWCRVM